MLNVILSSAVAFAMTKHLRVSPRPLILWAASGYGDKVKHGHWMRPSSMPWTVHPTQLCDCRVMLACPATWVKYHPELQTGPKCPACLAVVAELLTRALAVLG